MFPFFPDTAYALGGTGGGDPTSTMMGILPLVAMFAIFYFLLIRPQQKRTKDHKALVDALKRGDEVVTSGGLHGKVTGITDEVLTLEVAQNVRVRVQRGAIGTVKKSGG